MPCLHANRKIWVEEFLEPGLFVKSQCKTWGSWRGLPWFWADQGSSSSDYCHHQVAGRSCSSPAGWRQWAGGPWEGQSRRLLLASWPELEKMFLPAATPGSAFHFCCSTWRRSLRCWQPKCSQWPSFVAPGLFLNLHSSATSAQVQDS